jgi:hypothetical protein
MLDAVFRGSNSRTGRRSSTWRQRTNRSLADDEYRVTFEIERIADAAVGRKQHLGRWSNRRLPTAPRHG